MKKLKAHATIFVMAGLLSACAPFQAGSVRIGDTPARRIAKDATVTGKYANNGCLPFARALHSRFQAAGIPSKVVSFKYETLSGPRALVGVQQAAPPINDRGGLKGAHAVVIYEDHGRRYVIDNQSWQPKWIRNGSAAGMAQQFCGMNIAVGCAQEIEGRQSAATR